MKRAKKTGYKTAMRPFFAIARSRATAEAGQSLMEFALLLPMLLLLLTGIAEIGRAAFYSITVANAATAGTEFGSQDDAHADGTAGDGNMRQASVIDGNGIVTLTNTTALHACKCDDGTGLSCGPTMPSGDCTTIACGNNAVVDCVKVTTHETFDPLFHWPGLPTSYQANGSSIMRVRPQQ